MLEPSVQLMKEKADSKYTLAMLAAKRARDIIDGKPVLIDIDIDKPVSIAVHEIAENLITYKRFNVNCWGWTCKIKKCCDFFAGWSNLPCVFPFLKS